MIKVTPFYIAFLLMTGDILPLCAQELYSVQFRAFVIGQSIEKSSVLCNEGEQTLRIPNSRRSQVINYTGERTIQFFNQASASGVAGPPIASVKIPGHIQKALLIFIEKPNAPSTYAVKAYDDSLTTLNGGSTMFVNLSRTPMTVLLGEDGKTRVKLDSWGSTVHHFEQSSVNVRTRIATLVDDQVKKGMDTRIFPLKKFRDICFIYPNDRNQLGRVQMRLLRESMTTAQTAFSRSSNNANGQKL